MGFGGIWQWVIVLAIILLLFGTKKLRNMGSDLGHAVKGFRKGMKATSDSDAEPVNEVDGNINTTAEAAPAPDEKPATDKVGK